MVSNDLADDRLIAAYEDSQSTTDAVRPPEHVVIAERPVLIRLVTPFAAASVWEVSAYWRTSSLSRRIRSTTRWLAGVAPLMASALMITGTAAPRAVPALACVSPIAVATRASGSPLRSSISCAMRLVVTAVPLR